MMSAPHNNNEGSVISPQNLQGNVRNDMMTTTLPSMLNFGNPVSKEVQTLQDSLTRQSSCYLTPVGKKKEKSVSYNS